MIGSHVWWVNRSLIVCGYQYAVRAYMLIFRSGQCVQALCTLTVQHHEFMDFLHVQEFHIYGTSGQKHNVRQGCCCVPGYTVL